MSREAAGENEPGGSYSGSSSRMMDSSCEFVNIGEDEIKDAQENAVDDRLTDVVDEQEDCPPLEDPEASKDEELRHLMGILQERVRSGSPSHSVVSTDSDFIHLREPEELMDVSNNSSAGSRFNIIINRDINPLDHSDSEDEELSDMLDEEALPDADDRVESDIVVPQPVQLQEAPDELAVVVPPVRHYIHSPNRHLNTFLTAISLTALGFAVGIAIGHGIGSAREAHLQQEIQEGQKLRLRSVQDDLLMCLRKQEDIDQTINKLNEIENILVDAEHWRNEYEELLNLKLQNEEKWRVERSELKASLTAVEKSYDQLVLSKSCAHDSEYLSRQESTLKSVHEKLEASLTDKDQLTEKLKANVLNLKVSLLSADKMVEAYRKSNDDKSLLILGLKEKLLVLEREMFDMKINSEDDNEHLVASELNTQYNSMAREVDTQETTKNSVDVITEPAVVSASYQAEAAAVPDTDGDEQALHASHTGEAADILTTDSEPLADVPAGQPVVDSGSQLVVENYRHEIGQLQQKIAALQDQIRKYETDQSTDCKKTECNNTNTPCIAFNFCDYLKINISRDELLQAYETTHGQYKSLQAFLLSEWRSFVGERRQSRVYQEEQTQDNAESAVEGDDEVTSDDRPVWKRYMSQTQSVVSDLLDTMNSSWQGVNELSQKVGETKFAKSTQEKMSNVANIISRNVGVVKNKLAKVFDGAMRRVDSTLRRETSASSAHYVEPSPSEKEMPTTNQNVEMGNKKFQRRLSRLRKDLHALDGTKVDGMKKNAKKTMYEKFDDFREDFSRTLMDPSLKYIRLWTDCQVMWWKLKTKGETIGDESFTRTCADSLLPWQMPSSLSDDTNKIDANWQFERAEMRKFHRDEPDDWFWRRSHDYETMPNNAESPKVPFPRDDL